MKKLSALLAVLALLATACGDAAAPPDTSTPETTASETAPGVTAPVETAPTETTSGLVTVPPTDGLPALTLEPVAGGFTRPTYVTTAPGDERLYVLLEEKAL